MQFSSVQLTLLKLITAKWVNLNFYQGLALVKSKVSLNLKQNFLVCII